jgi:dCTP diphosphatase
MISSTLLEEMLTFRRDRDWEKFHTTRNVASAICVEAAELLDIFRWARDSEISSIVSQQRSEIESEVADVAILLMYLCSDLNISLEAVVKRKLQVNREKYPVEKAKGFSTKYNNLDK